MDNTQQITTVEERTDTLADATFYLVTTIEGEEVCVPDNMDNKDRVLIQEWVDEGNTIT